MYEEAWLQPHIYYVGKSKLGLGLANPWSHTKHPMARFEAASKSEALYKYKEWLFTKLLPSLDIPGGFGFLDDWEKRYLSAVIHLARLIKLGNVRTLGCWCVNILNYKSTDTQSEECHAQMLYKACNQLIEKGQI
jgi:hypothetical protein